MSTPVRNDHAELECQGAIVSGWTSYSADSDLFTPVDSASVSLNVGTSSRREFLRNIERLKRQMPEGKEVKLWISSNGKRAVQGVYLIDGYQLEGDGESGTQFSVNLRDRAAYLLSAADPKLYTPGDSLVSVARKVCAPWGIDVTADHVEARDLRQARISKDKHQRLQAKARQSGVPPALMSEKIAASIDRGTITFDDFIAAQAGGLYRQSSFNATTGQRETLVDLRRDLSPVVSPLRAGGTFVGVPYSTATGLSSLQIYQLRVQDIRPQGGETRWDFLQRHAERNGLLMSMTPDGRLLLCGLRYEQPPSYRFIRRIDDTRENNIISGGLRVDQSNAYSEVVVYGRGKKSDEARSKFKGVARTKPGDVGHLPFPRQLVVRDNSIRSLEDAQRRAQYELAKSWQGARVFEYTVAGHSQNGLIFTPDTVATVIDEVTGVSAPHYVTARTLTRGNGQGPRTRIRLVPLGAIVLAKDMD